MSQMRYRYTERWQRLPMIFENLYVCRFHFCMITLPESQLKWCYQLLKVPAPTEKCHFRLGCMSSIDSSSRHISMFSTIVFGIIFKGTIVAFIQALLCVCGTSTVVTRVLQTSNFSFFTRYLPKSYFVF